MFQRYMREVYFLAAASLILPALGFLDGYSTLLCFFVFEVGKCMYLMHIILIGLHIPQSLKAHVMLMLKQSALFAVGVRGLLSEHGNDQVKVCS